MIRVAVVFGVLLLGATRVEAACGGVSPNITAGNFADLSNCSTTYTEGDTLTLSGTITVTGALSFLRGGITITAATHCGATLAHNAGSATLITLTRDLTHDTVIQDIQFSEGASHTNGIYVNVGGPAPPATNYNPVKVLNNCFTFTDGNLAEGMRVELVGGLVISGNDFSAPSTSSGTGNCLGGQCDQAINFTADAYETESWTTAATMGTADFDGLQNTYVETNAFNYFLNQAFDTSANARVVIRYNTMNESAGAGHGADTGPYGVRHVEIYNNTFIHVYYGDNPTCNLTLPVSRALNVRGGTAVITANNLSAVENDPCWGNAARNVQFEIQNLRRETTVYPCWGAGDPGYPTYGSKAYPAYHQVGQGTYNGINPLTSTGTLDPVYVWSNTGTMPLVFTDYAPNGCGAGAALIATYVVLDRDYALSARPGYTPYPYPWVAGGAAPLYRLRVTPP